MIHFGSSCLLFLKSNDSNIISDITIVNHNHKKKLHSIFFFLPGLDTGGQKWEQLRGWQRALRQDRHVQQADRRCLRGEAHLRNISVNL